MKSDKDISSPGDTKTLVGTEEAKEVDIIVTQMKGRRLKGKVVAKRLRGMMLQYPPDPHQRRPRGDLNWDRAFIEAVVGLKSVMQTLQEDQRTRTG